MLHGAETDMQSVKQSCTGCGDPGKIWYGDQNKITNEINPIK